MPSSRVIFRADGNARIGLGHLTRCLALADMLAPEFACVFAMREPSTEVETQVRQAGFDILFVPADLLPADESAWLHAHSTPHDIMVLDGYDFTPKYQRRLKQRRQAVVQLDDMVAGYQWADLVLNQAGGVRATDYQHEPGTTFCLGPAYALLRRPFREAAPADTLDVNRVFLNMGGADPDNQTLAVLHHLRHWLPQHQLDVVTGSAYPHQAALREAAQQWANVQLHHNLSAEQMAILLSRCGLKVCPPSGVAYECCAVGGLVLLHPIADNQQRLFSYLTTEKLALPLTTLPALLPAQLPELAQQLQQRQRAMFDGQAGLRLRRAFREVMLAYELTARRATAADMEQYLAWANDADVRRNAIQQEPIRWEQHQVWFTRRLHDPDTLLYFFELQDQPVGQVRIEFTGSEGLIDYSVAAGFRGQGLGLAVLRRAVLELRHNRPAPWTLVAQVKAGNLPSRRVFERLGFAAQPSVELHGTTYDVFRLAFAPPA
ncbi:UDP-2,4-diacetamido-2,4,6-trideoxy-beta-L-altropyranose hydrolase [Hymenobacter weizhouensis]|uniref:UDP-2,4-diacetamido-2,4, 6-trideoxy-beta-L-altropyranose hydrolase n=1 Tax=Hymenobacter sp. YIM 151500-1 TaxID=2987689 RepID=UPI002226439E|nr:UDP-2,4-diacetamido-2,4,6-trideoxy-beta-L-altropyranose hydrolase [Hymenobacter sp. YIM 151500-1]UYZ64519.1 UDP-2,4-diacetamido-2,4,6-trideoxy-beta-L-altropyranose hydrolase [Hymenobacter sp. YIM 151500-1]